MDGDKTVAEVRRRFAAAPEQVFAAFADPRLVSRWLTPSPEIKLSVLTFDFRIGGAYRFAYHVPSGQIMTVHGLYHAIECPSHIAFSWIIEPPDEHAGLESEVTAITHPMVLGPSCSSVTRSSRVRGLPSAIRAVGAEPLIG
jgi:uncharacterized protein YndB with AHSA1/START domain